MRDLIKNTIAEIGTDEVKVLLKLLKNMLKKGGYGLILIPSSLLCQVEMTVDNLQSSLLNLKSFQERGSHTSGIKPDFTSTFHLLKGSTTKRLSTIDNVPYVKHKLTKPKSKSAFLVHEMIVGSFSKLKVLLTPPNGSVIDPYSATFTTGIGALRAFLTCTAIKCDTQCFMAAKVRLIRIASMLKSKIDEDEK